ncbi:hypothetical protein LSUE1_G006744 [Lachnellula suecica]|uniref:Tetratricopeptide repeat protein n=1 Tax=Lachnellula suecica TaxID=602035 RepID=A0A8T9BW67_9HELO|nr:hypothetical protein LSUE1_G006744 [Lachnellula suecica]
MPLSDEERAKALTEEGNAYYKSNQLLKAIVAYKVAVQLDPHVAQPLRNLSIAYYEVGKYQFCKTTVEKALALEEHANNADMGTQVEKLNARLERAQLHDYKSPDKQQRLRRLEILNMFHRYRPSMLSCPEFYTVGHDALQSLFDQNIDKCSPDDKVVSMLMGGICDGRHLLMSLFHACNIILPLTMSIDMLWQDIVIWTLMDDLSNSNAGTDKHLLILTTLFFVWVGAMIPRYAFVKLHQIITRVLEALEAGKQPLSWLYLHEKDFALYVDCLKTWQSKALKVFPNAEVIIRVLSSMKDIRARMPGFMERVPAKIQTEKLLYEHAATRYPPKRFMELEDPKMLKLLDEYSTQPKINASKFKDYIQTEWNFNTTLTDTDWYAEAPANYEIGHDPFDMILAFRGTDDNNFKSATQLFDYLSPFFSSAAQGLKHVSGRCTVEVYPGDYVHFSEQVRFGLFQTSDTPYAS